MMREFPGIEKGISVWFDVNEIDTIQFINPDSLKSSVIQIPGIDDRVQMCIVTTRSGNKATVACTPDEIFTPVI